MYCTFWTWLDCLDVSFRGDVWSMREWIGKILSIPCLLPDKRIDRGLRFSLPSGCYLRKRPDKCKLSTIMIATRVDTSSMQKPLIQTESCLRSHRMRRSLSEAREEWWLIRRRRRRRRSQLYFLSELTLKVFLGLISNTVSWNHRHIHIHSPSQF